MKHERQPVVNATYLTPVAGAYLWDCDQCGALAGHPCRKMRKDSEGVPYIVAALKRAHPSRGKA